MTILNKNMMYLRYHNQLHKFYSQKDLAEILNISQAQISRIENGHSPKIEDVMAYSVFFRVSIDDLVFKTYNIKDKKFY